MLSRIALLALSTTLLLDTAHSQCHEWAHDFALSGLDGAVHAYATFDDGHGPALYVAGEFLHAGEQPASRIARWDGAHWSPLGSGTDGTINALAAYDDGSGPALYAGGWFQSAGGWLVKNIARWDGTSWSALGSGATLGTSDAVNALAVYDDGSGARLYAAGQFHYAGGLDAKNIARWSASGWDAFCSGADGYLQALTVFDDGSGPKLVVAGGFTQCGSVLASNIAAFDGNGFAALGAGTNGLIRALDVFDDGTGPALVAGGSFGSAGGAPAARIASWRAGNWSPLGSGLNGDARSLASFDEGSGDRLFVAGTFTQAGGQPATRLARWDGSNWSVPGTGNEVSPSAAIPALGLHDDGSGLALYVGTDVRIGASTWTHGLGRWNGLGFEAVGSPRNNELSSLVLSCATFDDGTGPALCALGMSQAGGNAVHGIASWNGTGWSPLAGGLPGGYPKSPLAVVDHTSGSRLYALVEIYNGSSYTSELRSWDGSNWTTVASTSSNSLIHALAAWDDGTGPALYVGGNFHSIGGIPAEGVARFDGLSWSALGSGLSGTSADFGANVLAALDYGSGLVLVAGGTFDTAGGLPALNIARWNGASWAPIGAGLAALPVSLASFDDGSGPSLYAGCEPVPQGHLRRWDGSSWSLVPSGPNNWIYALAVFDDGSGPALYAGGNFMFVGMAPANGLARWNGTQWSIPGGGVLNGTVHGVVYSLATFDDGTGGGPDLYVGGNFDKTGGVLSPALGKWIGCLAPIATFCHGDGGDMPCPCWNNGAAGHGCANSANASGAQLAWSGGTNPDTLVLAASGELASALSIFLQGNQQQAHTPFGDGLRCVAGSLKRLYVRSAGGGSVLAPIAGESSISARSAALGDTILAGTARYYQVYYRDPQPGFCAAPVGNTWNVTQGVVVNW